jgi:hypothetical protein
MVRWREEMMVKVKQSREQKKKENAVVNDEGEE